MPVPVSSRHRGCSGSKEGEPFMASNYFFSGRSISLFDRWKDFLVNEKKEEKRKIVGEFSSFSTIALRKEWSAASFPIPKDSGRKFARIQTQASSPPLRGSLIFCENSPPRHPRRVFVLFRLGHLPPSLPLSLSFWPCLIPSPTFCRRWLLSRCAH